MILDVELLWLPAANSKNTREENNQNLGQDLMAEKTQNQRQRGSL